MDSLHDAIVEEFVAERPDLEGRALRSVIVIAEFSGNGKRSIAHMSSDGASRELPPWAQAGLLADVLTQTLNRQKGSR
jgi:hypothetical protein